jgi:uncharacterized membrane protein YgdD (TMEM256/DUF423 family)
MVERPIDRVEVTERPHRIFFTIGCGSGALGVIFGAFGAHALKDRLGPQMIAVFETGVRYQMIHALALLIAGLAVARAGPRGAGRIATAGWLFLAGTIIFSGSLYVLTLTGERWIGAITPLGGLSFIAGWLFLLIGYLRRD